MCESENERYNQQDFAFFPTDGLLMPEPCNHAEDGEDDPDHIQGQLSVAVGMIIFQFAVLDAIAGIDVQPDQHP